MKSKIWIDIDEQNAPVIRVKAELTEDVRDKLFMRFFENDCSSLAVRFSNGIYEGDGEGQCKYFEAELLPINKIEII